MCEALCQLAADCIMYIIISKANAEVYDDVINSHAIYETIPNEDNEARGGIYLQDNSTYPNNGRYIHEGVLVVYYVFQSM